MFADFTLALALQLRKQHDDDDDDDVMMTTMAMTKLMAQYRIHATNMQSH